MTPYEIYLNGARMSRQTAHEYLKGAMQWDRQEWRDEWMNKFYEIMERAIWYVQMAKAWRPQ